jgi:hypothetical protein
MNLFALVRVDPGKTAETVANEIKAVLAKKRIEVLQVFESACMYAFMCVCIYL